MPPCGMRNETVSALLVVAIIASAGLGYLVGAGSFTSPMSKTSAETSVTTTYCTVLAPTIGVVIRVVEGGLSGPTSPISGARVGGQADGYCNNALQAQTLQPAVTNSTGWASLLDGGFGVYNLNISYEVGSPHVTESYYFSVSMQPETVTYVIFNTTTGNVTTYLCYSGQNCHF